jgi:hypothetical protein
MAAPFPIDDLVRAVLAGYQRATPPARQARAEQLAEQLRHSLTQAGMPITPPVARALFTGLAIGTTIAELHPGHRNAALAADLLAATARLTHPRVDLDGLDDPWGRSR